MARQRITAGMSISDIMSMPMSKFSGYTQSQQREIVSRLGSAANKRLKNLQSSGLVTPATTRMELSGGKISVRGKTGSELKTEFFRARDFLKSKFSRKREWNKFQIEHKQIDAPDDTPIDNSLAYAYFDVLSDTNPEYSQRSVKYHAVDVIVDFMKQGLTGSELVRKARRLLNEEYEQTQRDYINQEYLNNNPLDNNNKPKRFKRKRR